MNRRLQGVLVAEAELDRREFLGEVATFTSGAAAAEETRINSAI